jgi:peptidyl-prolyl cis-trans isomerase B (cyclophilin B)
MQAIVKEQGPYGLTDQQKETYKTVGGTPHLDGQYTVFGEVIEGLDIVEKIQNCETGTADRPKTDISMNVEVIED